MNPLIASDVGALVRQVGVPETDQADMVSIAHQASGFRTDLRTGPDKAGVSLLGLWQIPSNLGYDPAKLISDAYYNAQCMRKLYDTTGRRAWTVFNNGSYAQWDNSSRQAIAQAAQVHIASDGSDADKPTYRTPSTANAGGTTATGATTPAITYGPPSPAITLAGVGSALAAAQETPGPLTGLRVIGTDTLGDFSNVVIGKPTFEAGWTTIPNLQFTIADPQGDLLWQQRALWYRGARVTWADLELRIDEIKFEPGGHKTGQITITAIDQIVYALQMLRGERKAEHMSATQWLQTELKLAGLNPSACLLGESVPSQSAIARDLPDQDGGETSGSDVPSAWTTIQRLAKELGKRCFISGHRIVFGSSAFAMRWASPGNLRIGWHLSEDGERWMDMPTGTQTSIGSRSGTTQVEGKVPFNRALFFRPGVKCVVHNTPSIAAGDREFIVTHVKHELARDPDGADVTLNEPIDPNPSAAGAPIEVAINSGPTSNGTQVSGGSSDGQVDQFVSLCLQQVGARYQEGSKVDFTDPNPNSFDAAEMIQWAAGRTGIIPALPSGSAAQIAVCKQVSVDYAAGVKGALLYRPGHIAVSLGNGRVVEALPTAGVVQGQVGDRFTKGGLIPGAKGYR